MGRILLQLLFMTPGWTCVPTIEQILLWWASRILLYSFILTCVLTSLYKMHLKTYGLLSHYWCQGHLSLHTKRTRLLLHSSVALTCFGRFNGINLMCNVWQRPDGGASDIWGRKGQNSTMKHSVGGANDNINGKLVFLCLSVYLLHPSDVMNRTNRNSYLCYLM